MRVFQYVGNSKIKLTIGAKERKISFFVKITRVRSLFFSQPYSAYACIYRVLIHAFCACVCTYIHTRSLARGAAFVYTLKLLHLAYVLSL